MDVRFVIKGIHTNARFPGKVYAKLYDMDASEDRQLQVCATLAYCLKAAKERGAKTILIEDLGNVDPSCFKLVAKLLA
jgi:hypothetical protein